MKRLSALLAGTAAVVVMLILSSGGSAQTPAGRTFTLYEDATHETIRVIDNAPKSPSPNPGSKRFRLSPGDQLAGQTPLLDRKGGKRIGDRKSTRLNSSHIQKSRMPSSA